MTTLSMTLTGTDNPWAGAVFAVGTTLRFLLFSFFVVGGAVGTFTHDDPARGAVFLFPWLFWMWRHWKLAKQRQRLTLGRALFGKWLPLLISGSVSFLIFVIFLLAGIFALVQCRFVPGIPWRALALIVPYALWYRSALELTNTTNNPPSNPPESPLKPAGIIQVKQSIT